MLEKLKEDWKNNRVALLIVLAVVVVATVFGKGVCYFRNITGIPCPGCGMTRSFLYILQGEFAKAWQMHPFAYGWIVLAVIFFVDRYVIRGKEVLWHVALIVLCAGMLVFYVYRLFTGGLSTVGVG